MITVAGLAPSLDLTYRVDTLRVGEIHRVGEVVRCAGGKPLNMARAASTMAAECAVVAILGGPTGAALAQMLQTEGLAVTVIESPAETRVCVSISAEDSGQLTEVYQDSPAVPEAVWRSFCDQLDAALGSRPGWLSISGRAPAGPVDMIADLVRRGLRADVRVAVDTSGAALAPALAAGPTLVKINRYEAAAELGVPPDDDLLTMAGALAERSRATVVLTDGTAGAIAVEGARALHASAPGAPGRYPVGSGDSFLGGLLAALDGGAELRQALRTATACGVANALTPGQGRFSVETVQQVAAAVELRALG